LDNLKIVMVGPEAASEVLELVAALLRELGEEGDETGAMDVADLTAAWRTDQAHHVAFLAYDEETNLVGVATVSTAFALNAQGRYGIINEMYVSPDHRSLGVGTRLIETIKDHGREQGWRRIDVTAPEATKWKRTRRFYEDKGFSFTGPKLKFFLD
jgi:GNAT superfamily N-acetyltransferase